MAEPYLGQILAVGFNFAPVGWMMCNGQTLPVNTNQALFALLGTTYGGDGITNFKLPDLRGRVLLGFGQGTSPLPNYIQGQLGGAAAVPILAANLPPHTHPVAPPVSNAGATTTSPVNTYPAVDTATISGVHGATLSLSSYAPQSAPGQTAAPYATGSAGTGTALSIEPPFLAINYIIAVQGIFPSRQ